MATYKGQDGVFQAIDPVGGTLATVSNLKSWSISQTVDSIETSTMGATGDAKTFTTGQSSWSATCELLYDLTNATQADLIVGALVDIKIWPNTVSEAESWAGSGIVTDTGQSGALGDMVGSSITVQGTGVLTTVA